VSKRVETKVDVSNLGVSDYYIDERSKRLEKLLRSDTRFREYRVRRQHWKRNREDDPFVIQNDEEFDLIILETVEVNTLSDSEFLSYIDVEMKRLECSENTTLFLLATIALMPFAIIFSAMIIIDFSYLNIVRIMILSFAIILLTIFSTTMYLSKRRVMMSGQREVDLKAARDDVMFLSALRKLADIPANDELKTENYRKRLQDIDGAHRKL